MQSVIYLTDRITNTDRKFGSALRYQPVVVTYADGGERPCLLTCDAVQEGLARGDMNSEDAEIFMAAYRAADRKLTVFTLIGAAVVFAVGMLVGTLL